MTNIRPGDTIKGSYETTERTVQVEGRVISDKGDYAFIPDPRGGSIGIHHRNITHVNGKKI